MQNEMRDRLEQMVIDAEIKWQNSTRSFSSVCADHLIENGVIVPPCKVGQTVWLIKSLNWQRTEWGIKEGKISMIQQKADKSWKFRVTENRSVQDYTVDSIGKTVFLTKEEAEQALKGGVQE
jgi:hypothetical protein